MGRLAEGLRSYWLGETSLRDPALTSLFGGVRTMAGANVTEYSALNYSAWWSAVQLISNAVAALPLFLYKRLPIGGKERFTSHRIYRLLHDEFNTEMTSFTARKTVQAHVLSWGNGYAEIQRNQAEDPIALWPITPDRVTPDRINSEIVYRIRQTNGPEARIPARNMLHIPGLGFDGLMGYSVVRMARETLGLGIAARNYGAQFFGNGAVSSLVAQHPGQLSDKASQHLKDSINQAISGDKKHSVLVTEEGIKVEKISIPPDDAQFLGTNRQAAIEVCKILNIPPHKLAELDRATFSNIEHQAIEFVTDCLRPWLVVWEQELNRKLIRPLERGIQFVEHLVDGLLRGDIQSRYQAYAVARQWGWASADDVRELENMNPLPDGQGQLYLVPINMAPADRIGDLIDAQIAAKTAPAPPPNPTAGSQDPTPPARVAKIVEDLRNELQAGLADFRTDVVTMKEAIDGGNAAVLERVAALPAPEQGVGDRVVKALDDAEQRIAGEIKTTGEATTSALDPSLQELREDAAAARADILTTRAAVEATQAAVIATIGALPAPERGVVDRFAAISNRLDEMMTVLCAADATLVEAIRLESTAIREALLPKPAEVVPGPIAPPAPDPDLVRDLREWQRAAVAAVVGRLVRRELAHAGKLGKDPARAGTRLITFYPRHIEDSLAELRPWLIRFGAEVEPRVRPVITLWAAQAQAELQAALPRGGLEDILRRWEIERAASLTTALMEAIHVG